MLNGLQWAFYSRTLLSCFLNPYKLLGSPKNSTAQLGNIWRNIVFLFCFALLCYGLFCLCLNLPPISLGRLSYNRYLNLSKQSFPLKALEKQLCWWYNELNSEPLLCFMPQTEIQTRCLCQGATITARIIYHLCVIFWPLLGLREWFSCAMHFLWVTNKKCLCWWCTVAKQPR